MNKKAISPLLSTVILILLAVGIGVVVMNWGRAQIEVGTKCSIETGMNVVTLNRVPQVCFSGQGENGFIKFIVENGAQTDITAVKIRTIGSNEIYNMQVPDSRIEKGYTIQKIIPYNFNIFGKIKQIRLTPAIKIYDNEPSVLCPEQAITIESIKEC